MDVRVRYFAAAADAAGQPEETLKLGDGATLGDLKKTLIQRHGAVMTRVVETGSFLVDSVVRRDPTYPLADRVDVLPPFAGG
jgi:molybdopterin synthase sulfur carrier subunit